MHLAIRPTSRAFRLCPPRILPPFHRHRRHRRRPPQDSLLPAKLLLRPSRPRSSHHPVAKRPRLPQSLLARLLHRAPPRRPTCPIAVRSHRSPIRWPRLHHRRHQLHRRLRHRLSRLLPLRQPPQPSKVCSSSMTRPWTNCSARTSASTKRPPQPIRSANQLRRRRLRFRASLNRRRHHRIHSPISVRAFNPEGCRPCPRLPLPHRWPRRHCR